MWPIGLSTGCFYRTPILDVLDLICEEGFDILEICSFPKHLDYHDLGLVEATAKRLRELDLIPFSMHAPFAPSIDITSLDDTERNRSTQEILAAVKAAAILGVQNLVIHPGPEWEGSPPTKERYQRLENAASSLGQINQPCRESGIRLLVENMLPHLLFGHVQDTLFILGAMDATDVGVCLDTGHAYLSGELLTVADKLCGHLKMLHANDNFGDKDAHLPPGTGAINWPQLLSKLVECGFDGTIILELAGDGVRSGHEILAGARSARKFLQDYAVTPGEQLAGPGSERA